ncbi:MULTISPECIES: CRISPR-associated endonuclease Cas6 [unclassified Candidatus Frackibacter]|uniref:CRISPR-associated endonuclease Cas6 n=1 Tax=unclassified Candidatus Frackibacter TaxID=2648818 RepID=UPI00088550B2|nr:MULTISPECIES: CRISPR-associated endonuclease Cas6 [unclassified Candidatus Frackibacter]SDC86129.1 hypothetical protein SAMN04515661_13217 [Candidatus Frackibacter sp. WG11]SEN00440.1 hypothetical protein SAMN04488698_13416 [Candidatus Frackibacter sp. WG12]SFL55767.1 hypothetical protein SAMN04488699_10598 [Candidatus Frackibacter sp. WG13]
MPQIKKAILQFNIEDDLSLRYGHKLRGFFANNFADVLFHNHKEDGSYRYAYPLIQYKIIGGKPTVIGLVKGAELIINNFLDINQLTLGEKEYIQPEGRLEVVDEDLEVISSLEMPKFKYEFYSPWMGLNQKNHRKYLKKIKDQGDNQKREFFKRILIGNILTFAKGMDWWIEEDIKVVPNLEPIDIQFKNEDMIGFVGEFYSNVSLPKYIGLGKSTARGFGTIFKEEII